MASLASLAVVQPSFLTWQLDEATSQEKPGLSNLRQSSHESNGKAKFQSLLISLEYEYDQLEARCQNLQQAVKLSSHGCGQLNLSMPLSSTEPPEPSELQCLTLHDHENGRFINHDEHKGGRCKGSSPCDERLSSKLSSLCDSSGMPSEETILEDANNSSKQDEWPPQEVRHVLSSSMRSLCSLGTRYSSQQLSQLTDKTPPTMPLRSYGSQSSSTLPDIFKGSREVDASFRDADSRNSVASRKTRNTRMSTKNGNQIDVSVLSALNDDMGVYRLAIWRFMSDPESSLAARLFSFVMNPFYVLTMLFAMAQHTNPPLISYTAAAPLEIGFELAFAIDICLRFIVCPSKAAFLREAFNWIDFLSSVPMLLRLIWIFGDGDYADIQELLLCVVPILRLMRLQRRFEQFHLIYTAFLVTVEAMPVLFYTIFVVILTFSTVIYAVEPRTNIPSLPQALWFVIVTVNTVGYGDVVPKSELGQLLTTGLIFMTMLLLAIPVGIVGAAFNRVWEDRSRLLLLKRTRVRLGQWSYDATGIPKLFTIYGSGNAIDFQQFREMMTDMKIGLSDVEVWELFSSFDTDNGGSITPEEFCQNVFPDDFRSMVVKSFRDSAMAPERPASERASSHHSATTE